MKAGRILYTTVQNSSEERVPLEKRLCSNGRRTGIDKRFVETSQKSIQQKQKNSPKSHIKTVNSDCFF